MNKKKSLLNLLRFLLIAYGLACLTVYAMQQHMLFPAYMTSAVPSDWQPTAGDMQEQALLNGQCGKLHVASWKIRHAGGTVMMFHGNGENIISVQTEAAKFHALGYNVMSWDYPGYGMSEPCWFSEEDLLKDAETAYQWLLHSKPATPVVLYGRSVGSGLALHVASQHPGHRVLLVSPYDSLLNVANDHRPFLLPTEFLMRYPLHADHWIGKVKGEIHAIHGTADVLIKPERATALMQAASTNADIEWVENAGHNDITLFEQSDRWLAKQLTSSP